MKSKLLPFIMLLAFVNIACDDLYEVPEQVYLIKAGDHQSHLMNGWATDELRVLKQRNLTFTARFDETARYSISKRNQRDINKLMGFSDTNSFHHDNSIRFGWRYNAEKDNIEIFGYQYRDGLRQFERIAEVAIGETATYDISLLEDEYLLSVNGGKSLAMPRTQKKKLGVYYMLFPYFGGNEKAPHDIKIYIKELHRGSE